MAAHKFWRLKVNSPKTPQDGVVVVGDIEFRTQVTGDNSRRNDIDATEGGRAWASSFFDTFTPDKAFDNDPEGSHRWLSAFNSVMPQYIGCELVTAADVVEIALASPYNDGDWGKQHMPDNFELQFADAEAGPWVTKTTYNSVGYLWPEGGTYQTLAVVDESPVTPPAPTDTTPPALVSITTSAAGGNLRLNFGEDLGSSTLGQQFSAANGVPVSAFSLSIAGKTLGPLAASSDPRQVVLSLSPELYAGESGTLSYTQPASGAMLRDAAGNPVASFSNFPITNSSTVAAPAPGGTTPPASTVPNGVPFRYIRLFISANNGDGFLGMQEVELRATVGGPDLTTAATPVIASSSYPGETGPNLVNRNLTSPQGGWTAADPVKYPQTVTFDLGAAQVLAEITILRNPADYATGRAPKDFIVQGSNTGMDANDFLDITAFTGISGYVVGTPKVLTLTYPLPDVVKPKVATIVTNSEGDKIVLQLDEAIAGAAAAWPAAAFTVSNRTFTALERTLNSREVQFAGLNPVVKVGDAVTLAYAKPSTGGLADPSGNQVDSFGPLVVTNNVRNRPRFPGFQVRIYGDSVDADFNTPDQLAFFLNNLNCVSQASMFLILLEKTLVGAAKNFQVGTTNDQYYAIMQPMPGQSFDELEPDTAPGAIGTLGIGIESTGATFTQGLLLKRLRILTSGTTGINNSKGNHNGEKGGVSGCRIRHTGTGPVFFGGWGGQTSWIEDTLIEVDANNTALVMNDQGFQRLRRNTIVRLNGAAGYSAIRHEYNGSADKDNVFVNCGGSPFEKTQGETSGNYTNTALSAGAVGVTYVPGAFLESATNYRPAANSALLGVATRDAISTPDNNGNNRGLTPDAGAFQRVPSTPLATGAVVSQPPPNGESFSVEISTTNNPTSALITFSPDPNKPSEAITQGPFELTLGANKASGTFDDLASGAYVVTITLGNAGGVTSVPGLAPFEIMGTSANTSDQVNPGPATAFTWAPPTSGVAGVQSDPFPVGVDGVLSNTYRFTPVGDGGAVFTPAFLDLTPGAPSGLMRVMRPTAGESTLSAATNANGALRNPPNVTFQVIPAPVVQPTTPTVTVAVNVVGKIATITGTVNPQGDANAQFGLFLDPQPSGTPVQLPTPAITNGAFTASPALDAGAYKVRARLVAKGQTVEAVSAEKRVLDLAGNLTLPA